MLNLFDKISKYWRTDDWNIWSLMQSVYNLAFHIENSTDLIFPFWGSCNSRSLSWFYFYSSTCLIRKSSGWVPCFIRSYYCTRKREDGHAGLENDTFIFGLENDRFIFLLGTCTQFLIFTVRVNCQNVVKSYGVTRVKLSIWSYY